MKFSIKSGLSAIALLSSFAISLSALATITSGNPIAQAVPVRLVRQILPVRPTPNPLPNRIRRLVIQTHAQQLQVPQGRLQVVAFSQETWSNSCLDLQKPNERCAGVITPGWRVEVSDGSQNWLYRTDNTGRVIRAENLNNVASLPDRVGQKVLALASRQSGIPVAELKLVDGRSRTWDGCLGVAGPDQMCTMIAIPGWQVIVAGRQQYWVYHLNQTGEMIKLNPTTSGKGTIAPTFWEPEVASPSQEVNENVLLQSVTTGGIAGLSFKTLLLKDGQVIRIEQRGNGGRNPRTIRKLSPQQLQAFIQLLRQNELDDFFGFNYPASTGADYFTIALMTPSGQIGVQYADMIQDQTPAALQRIITAWNRIATP